MRFIAFSVKRLITEPAASGNATPLPIEGPNPTARFSWPPNIVSRWGSERMARQTEQRRCQVLAHGHHGDTAMGPAVMLEGRRAPGGAAACRDIERAVLAHGHHGQNPVGRRSVLIRDSSGLPVHAPAEVGWLAGR